MKNSGFTQEELNALSLVKSLISHLLERHGYQEEVDGPDQARPKTPDLKVISGGLNEATDEDK